MPKRGLIALVLIWALLLFVPAFKTQTQEMIRAPFSGGAGEQTSISYLFGKNFAKGFHSDSPQLKIAELQTRNVSDRNKYWRDWDALMAKYPDNLNARRARLVATTRKGSLVRPIYETGDLRKLDSAGRFKLKEDDQWQNDAQRLATARAARVGEKLAPDDSFFPWMEAMALWNRDDEAALRALERAGKKNDFDDGVMANARALLRAREEQISMGAVEKLAVILSALLPHYAEMRQLAREVTWSGIAHYRRGDKAGAYRRWRIAMQAGGAFGRGESHGPQANLIGLYVAQACQSSVWETVALELNPPARTVGRKPSQDALLRGFESLARRDGYADLAAYAARANATAETHKFRDLSPEILETIGFNSPLPQAALQLPLATRAVIWLSLAGALGLLICVIWRRFVGGAHWHRASAPQIAFFGALWVGALSLAVWARAVDQSQEFSGGDRTPVPLASCFTDLLNPSSSFWLCLTGTFLLAGTFCYWQNAREKGRLLKQVLPRDQAATAGGRLPKLIGIAWFLVLLSTLFWFSVSSGETNAPLIRMVWIVCCAVALALTLWRIERSADIDKPRSRLAIVGTICALAALGLMSLFEPSSQVNDMIFYLFWLCFFAALAVALYLFATTTSLRALAPSAFAVALQTLGGVAVVCSVVLLITSLAALPVRTRQNRIVDDYIARGEIDWMRNQPSFRKASAAVDEN